MKNRNELEEIDKLEKQLASLKKEALEREAKKIEEISHGDDDTELIRRAYKLLSYVTYHDNRYGQADNWEKFMTPAQRLVPVLAKRLGIKAYETT